MQLYIYWKVAPVQLAEALRSVRAFQAGCGACAQLLQRVGSAGPITLMETYVDLDGPACDALLAKANAALGHLALDGRHAERFEPA